MSITFHKVFTTFVRLYRNQTRTGFVRWSKIFVIIFTSHWRHCECLVIHHSQIFLLIGITSSILSMQYMILGVSFFCVFILFSTHCLLIVFGMKISQRVMWEYCQFLWVVSNQFIINCVSLATSGHVRLKVDLINNLDT